VGVGEAMPRHHGPVRERRRGRWEATGDEGRGMATCTDSRISDCICADIQSAPRPYSVLIFRDGMICTLIVGVRRTDPIFQV